MAEAPSHAEAIRALLARYTYNGDRGRLADLAACFASDGVLEYPGAQATGPEGIAVQLGSGKPNPDRTFVRHHITAPLIEIAGEAATARSYFLVVSNNGPDHSGTYDDRLVLTPDGWRFAHRRVRIDWQSPDSLWPLMTTR
jgi:hypothetical protein